jgi:hypothetical protein
MAEEHMLRFALSHARFEIVILLQDLYDIFTTLNTNLLFFAG